MKRCFACIDMEFQENANTCFKM